MKREISSSFTPAIRVHVKHRFASVFRALHGDAKRHADGISGLAVQLGKNPVVMCNKLNPDYLDSTPTAEDLLEVIEQAGARSAVQAIAQLVGLAAVELPPTDAAPTAVVPAFLELIRQCGSLMAEAAQDLADGRLDADERLRCAALLDALLPSVVQMRALVRS
jgi:hypothetical protein